MSVEQMEARLAALEKQQGTAKKRFTDSLEIPEDIDAAGLKKILNDFESYIQDQYKAASTESEQARKQREFDQAVEVFKSANPDIFKQENSQFLDIMNGLLHSELSSGLPPSTALEKAYAKLKEVSRWEEPKKEEPKKEEKKEAPAGTLDTTLNVEPAAPQKKEFKDTRSAVTSSLLELKSEGNKSPFSTAL